MTLISRATCARDVRRWGSASIRRRRGPSTEGEGLNGRRGRGGLKSPASLLSVSECKKEGSSLVAGCAEVPNDGSHLVAGRPELPNDGSHLVAGRAELPNDGSILRQSPDL